jgi:deoxyribose-phosphate aldolase
MTIDLKALAERVAREMAAADQRRARGAPPEGQNTTPDARQPHRSTATPIIPSRTAQTEAPPGVRFVRENARVADFIDHTLLKAEATRADVEKLCDEAREHRFAAVCVNPVWVADCARRLSGSGVAVATVVGFPLGASTIATKTDETRHAVGGGAGEIDMVAAIGAIKSGDWQHVGRDIEAVVRTAGSALVKVIIESAVLTPVEIVKACTVAREVGANYVKTSTGFHPSGGATAEAVALMRLVVGDSLGVKASGGVRDCATALRMIAAGATRIGTSSGVAMAACLGPGPLPLGALLDLAARHATGCSGPGCAVEPEPAASIKAY